MPVICVARTNFSTRYDSQLTTLHLNNFSACQVLNGLGEGSLGAAYRYPAAIRHRRCYANRFAGHVSATVQVNTTLNWATANACQTQSMYDITFERLLVGKKKMEKILLSCSGNFIVIYVDRALDLIISSSSGRSINWNVYIYGIKSIHRKL